MSYICLYNLVLLPFQLRNHNCNCIGQVAGCLPHCCLLPAVSEERITKCSNAHAN